MRQVADHLNQHAEKTTHPYQFRVELVKRLVALKYGRQGYGWDVVDEYVEIPWERVRALQEGILCTRPMGKSRSAILGNATVGIDADC